ncbi:MAG: hypothetical protein P8P70_08475 [Sulfitobacter sp.]|nr:hypothetical protein [Sulfitobacter sp.]
MIDIDEIKIASGDRPYGEIVEEKSHELTEILLQDSRSEKFRAIRYAIREMMRNAVEHSLGQKIVIFGQYWPAREQAEIVIYDTGVGIASTLTDAKIGDGLSDVELLKVAIMPGVSSVSSAEMDWQNALWKNSGFGLFVTSRFCSKRGVFRVISGTAGITVNRKTIVDHDWRFDGTCIQMKIDTAHLDEAEKDIHEIISEGEQLLGGGKTASKITKSLGA